MANSRSPRGFTLIEAVISLAISSIVLVLAVRASNTQQRAFFQGERLRAAQSSSRDALLYLERAAPLVGFGMDPALALDFQWHVPAACPPEVDPCTRDRTDDADELVFYTRNPNYWVPTAEQDKPPAPGEDPPAFKGKAWRLSAISNGTISLDARRGDHFLPNQILQVVCPATLKYAYVTVSDRTPATDEPLDEDTDDLEIPLHAAAESNPFRRQDEAVRLAMDSKCRAFQIDRYRFHVVPVATGDGHYDPFLVLDDGVHPEVMLAEGVEAFQVAYLLANGGVVGADPGTATAFPVASSNQTVTDPGPEQIALTAFPGDDAPTGETKYWPSSYYRYSSESSARKTIHQANIRALRIGVVVRSPSPDTSTKSNWVANDGFTLLNQEGVPSWVADEPQRAFGTDGYQRVRVETTINLPNMLVRSIPAF